MHLNFKILKRSQLILLPFFSYILWEKSWHSIKVWILLTARRKLQSSLLILTNKGYLSEHSIVKQVQIYLQNLWKDKRMWNNWISEVNNREINPQQTMFSGKSYFYWHLLLLPITEILLEEKENLKYHFSELEFNKIKVYICNTNIKITFIEGLTMCKKLTALHASFH